MQLPDALLETSRQAYRRASTASVPCLFRHPQFGHFPLTGVRKKFAVRSRDSASYCRELSTPSFPLVTSAPHAEHRLLIKFRAEASLEERHQSLASYGEPELQTRRVGESVLTLKLKENECNAGVVTDGQDRGMGGAGLCDRCQGGGDSDE